MLFIILMAIHIIVCLLLLVGIELNIIKVHRYMFFVALLLPFWGVLVLLMLHFQILFEKDDTIDVGVEKMKLESQLYKSITVDETSIAATTVPIEEALLVNSPRERRSIIMDVLNDNPREYIEFLQKAGNNEDTEVVHYAVTAMVEISKENDYKLQDFERRYQIDPEDDVVLQEYTDFLWNCLSQKLMMGQVEVINRELFSTLMQKKLSKAPSVEDFSRAIENDLMRKEYSKACDNLAQMKKLYSDREEYYILKLKYLALNGKGYEIKKLIKDIENKEIFLTSKAKEVLAFWQN